MKVSKIVIKNYRLLKEFSIDLEDNLSLVIGKNNTGKTSFLSLLERFLIKSETNEFVFDDFNLEFQTKLKGIIEKNEPIDDFLGINLKLYIQYDEQDDLSNISSLMLDLDPNERLVILSFEYALKTEKLEDLKKDYLTSKNTQTALAKDDTNVQDLKDVIYFLKKKHDKYFKKDIKALENKNESNFRSLKDERISIDKIIKFNRIKAKRDVTNKDGTYKESDKTLSKMSSKYYSKIADEDTENKSISDLKEQLSKTDNNLNSVYDELFKKIIDKVKKFGGIKENESIIRVVSSLEERNIIAENTTVMYDYNNQFLPEDYNGLGYLNLLALIFEIEVLLNDFKQLKKKDEKPANINLLFIEEPEAHTHPQMQYVFIKNIKDILDEARKGKGEDGIKFNLQTIITTHSSHITKESDFEDIKYFYKESTTKVIAKNLKNLQKEYKDDDPKDYQFLKQYLTLSRAELFFADKAIFIEGDTERLLLPAMMKKLDNEEKDDKLLPLLSQNISIVEVGAYTQVFDKFIDFLGIKTLIITDIDSSLETKKADKNGKIIQNQDGTDKMTSTPCRVRDANITKNTSLKFYYSEIQFNDLKTQKLSNKILKRTKDKWSVDANGNLCVIYQTEEEAYHARSFEDAFIHINRTYLNTNKGNFKGLKNRKYFDDVSKDAFELADECVGNSNKTAFALDILFNSDDVFSNWKIPAYIKEGLLWLKK
jgi:predicted ATP-dependent endonuclease of OLD family